MIGLADPSCFLFHSPSFDQIWDSRGSFPSERSEHIFVVTLRFISHIHGYLFDLMSWTSQAFLNFQFLSI